MSRTSVSLAACGLLVAGTLGFSPTASAGTMDIIKAENAFSIGLGVGHLQYKETDTDGSRLDAESATVPALSVAFDLMDGSEVKYHRGGVYLHLGLDFAKGSGQYDGQLMNGTPYRTSSDETFIDFNGRIGKAYLWGDSAIVTPFVELGYHAWTRDLQGPSGYEEDYSNWTVMGGLLAQFSPVERWVFSGTIEGGTTFGGKLSALGDDFTLGKHSIWSTEARIGYRFNEDTEFYTAAKYTDFGYGRSNVTADGFVEPDSKSKYSTLTAGLSFHFL